MTAYLRERFHLRLFAPLALAIALVASASGAHWATVVVDAGFALLLLAQFRLWDDLADRPRDAVTHPDRVLVRAGEVTPAIGFCGALAVLNICLAVWRDGMSVAILGGLNLAAGAWYLSARSRDPVYVPVLLTKYPAFVFVVAGGRLAEAPLPVVAGAAALYLVVCAYEAWHDPLNWRSMTWR